MAKTAGEIVFEEYLSSIGITTWSYERLFPESAKPPDYSFSNEGTTLLLDVKDFCAEKKDFEQIFNFQQGQDESSSEDEPAVSTVGCDSYDPYAPIRAKIAKGREKFAGLKDYPCALVLYNVDKPLVSLRPMFVYGAMLGNLGIRIPVDSGTGAVLQNQERSVFASGGKMYRYGPQNTPISPQNTTVSAVIVLGRLMTGQKICLDWLEKEAKRLGREMTWDESVQAIDSCRGTERDISRTQLRVTVCENPFARIQWPRNIFTGPWDQRYGGVEGNKIRRLYAGNALLEWEQLTGTVADFSK